MQNIALLSLLVLGAMGLVLGLVLALFSRIFTVRIDPRIAEVTDALAGLNCGVCGYPGCAAMAEALVAGKAKASQCTPGGPRVVKRVSELLGRSETPVEPSVAVVKCRGGKMEAKEKGRYMGVRDCISAELSSAGPKACVYGCLGMGSCLAVCRFGAISMSGDDLPVVDEGKCTGCGKCAAACPRHVMDLIPRSRRVFLACISRDKGKKVREICSAGCVACNLCATPKVTPSGKVVMRNNLPEFPPDWADFKAAVEKCPSRCFVVRIE